VPFRLAARSPALPDGREEIAEEVRFTPGETLDLGEVRLQLR